MQHKLAAILAVEVVGATGPKRAEGTTGELAVVQYELIDPTISRYGGRIFALLPATTLVEFAEPGYAVGCGLEIQRGIAEHNAEHAPAEAIGLRIGIDLGVVITAGGDLQGPPVAVARGLSRIASDGAVAISGRVARIVKRRKLAAESIYRGVHAVAGDAKVELVELRPRVQPKAQSPWTLRRRWTWIVAFGAIVLLAGTSLVLWRPVREWLLPVPTEAAGRLAPDAIDPPQIEQR